jgi:hypothetical protein
VRVVLEVLSKNEAAGSLGALMLVDVDVDMTSRQVHKSEVL